MNPIRSGWFGSSQEDGFKGKHKIQAYWEKTIYHVDGQPCVGLLVFRMTPVAGEGKVKILHWSLLLPFGGNIEESSENEGSWQGVDGPPDCILAVSEDGVPETEAVLTDPEPKGEGDAIHVHIVQTEYQPKYWVKTIWGWVKSIWAPIM